MRRNMRSLGAQLLLLVATSFTSAATATIRATAPAPTITSPPLFEALATYSPPESLQLLFRRAECPGDTFQCPTSLGAVFSDFCCLNGQTCAFDSSQNPACCPSGAVCTGTAPASEATADPTRALSYVPNSYFSFPYAPTTFDDSGACSTASSACSRNYNLCLTNLQGDNGYAVTIDVPGGGGTTIAGSVVNLDASSATSICSSLSTAACSEVEATSCDSYDSGSSLAVPPPMGLLAVVAAYYLAAMVLGALTP